MWPCYTRGVCKTPRMARVVRRVSRADLHEYHQRVLFFRIGHMQRCHVHDAHKVDISMNHDEYGM